MPNQRHIASLIILAIALCGCRTPDRAPENNNTIDDKSEVRQQKQKSSQKKKKELKDCVAKCLEARESESIPFLQLRSECEQQCAGIEN